MLCFENVRKVYKDFELNCSMRVDVYKRQGWNTGLYDQEIRSRQPV